ncbi:MAG: non-canonical purine NTP pyrophosphatase [Patescibacteria group bacterium]|nr:non-canonical purine NTP pyrophosphatase [Patescibacteria group bacterium]
MPLYFITGNQNKFNEIKAIIPDIEMMDLDLPEIQEIDPKAVIEAKLKEATAHHQGEFIVEDTSLCLDCLGGKLPGPLIKWFVQTLGSDGLYDLAAKCNDFGAEARTVIGYARSHDDIIYFEGVRRGQLVPPTGSRTFGWDPIFRPEGADKTQGEMTREEKNAVSQRGEAARELRQYLARP